MPRRDAPEFSYDANTKLYRKKIKNPEGRWVPVYGRTKPELREALAGRDDIYIDGYPRKAKNRPVGRRKLWRGL